MTARETLVQEKDDLKKVLHALRPQLAWGGGVDCPNCGHQSYSSGWEIHRRQGFAPPSQYVLPIGETPYCLVGWCRCPEEYKSWVLAFVERVCALGRAIQEFDRRAKKEKEDAADEEHQARLRRIREWELTHRDEMDLERRERNRRFNELCRHPFDPPGTRRKFPDIIQYLKDRGY